MAAKNAEKLIILGDVCRGLLARAYNLTGSLFRRPPTLNDDVDKVCKLLLKKFPEHPSTLDTTQGEDVFKKRAPQIAKELEDYYLTFVDIINFDRSAWDLLKEMSATIVKFQFDINLDLMVHFLDLFTGFVQLHLLISRITDAKLMLTVYARAYNCTHGNTEPEFLAISNYIIANEKGPLEMLRERCELISASVGEACVSFYFRVAKWFDPKLMVQQNVFGVLEDPSAMTQAKNMDDHMELMFQDKFYMWCLWGFMVCPQELSRDGALDLLGLCLRSGYQLQIYRDLMFDVWQEYAHLFDNFKRDKFKLSKHKKILKEAIDSAVEIVQRHQDTRTYLRQELNTLVHFFSEFPQIIAPKFYMLLTLMRVTRREVLWYFQHLGKKPFKAKKFVAEEEFMDIRISEPIYLLDKMSSLIRDNGAAIAQYHAQALVLDGKKLRPEAENFVKQVKLSHGIQDILGEIVSSLTNATPKGDFEAMRLNWYRISASINSQQSGVGVKAAGLNKEMTPILIRSRAVDRVNAQIKMASSWRDLFWYRKQLHQILMTGLSGTQGQPSHCMALLRVLHTGLENVHRFCPEEQKLIGTKAVATAELFFNAIITALASLLSGINIKVNSLRQQTAPTEVVNREQRSVEYKKKGGTEPVPGYESLFANRSVVNSLRVWKKSVAEICTSMRDTESVVVFNTEFIPREWLYEAVSKTIRSAIVRIALPEKSIARPSQLLQQIRDLIHAFQSIDHHVNINLSNLVREILHAEFAAPPSTSEEKKEAEDGPVLINAISSWYQALLQNQLSNIGVTFSPLKSGFVRTSSKVKFPAENYADVQELKALCTLCGPAGVRLIEKQLVGFIVEQVSSLKVILSANARQLNDLRGHFPERQYWHENVSNIRDADKVCEICTVIGVMLKFRQLLKRALGECLGQNIQFVVAPIKLAFSVVPRNTLKDAAIAPLDALASDIGLDLNSADHVLRDALRHLKTNLNDQGIWGLLPELFGATVPLAAAWREGTYLVETESHDNNLHCMAATAVALIYAFQGILVDATKNPNVERDIDRTVERCVRCVSYSILHLRSALLKDKYKQHQNSLPYMYMFVERMVLETNGRLKLSVLEEFFPYTLVRTNYTQMYERQDTLGRTYAPVVDEDDRAA